MQFHGFVYSYGCAALAQTKHVYHPRKEILCQLAAIPHFPHSSLATINLSVSVDSLFRILISRELYNVWS